MSLPEKVLNEFVGKWKVVPARKVLNKFLRQWKSQLVSENWKGYEESKVCEAPVGKDLQIFSTGW